MEKGIYVAALTPMHDDLKVDAEELAKHSLDLLERGCKGVVLFGTTGEGSSFSVKERLDALSAVIAKGVDPKKIILANGSANISDTIDLIEGAERHAILAYLIAPPGLYKNVSDEGVIEFYRTIIEHVQRIHVLLYHIPQLTGVPITKTIIKKLISEYPEVIIGLKESEGNLEYLQSILEAFPALQVYVGNELQIPAAMKMGAKGAICGLANCYPELIASLVDAEALPERLIKICEEIQDKPFISMFKRALEKERGKAWHRLRPPLVAFHLP